MRNGLLILGCIAFAFAAACGGTPDSASKRDDIFSVGDSPKVVVSSGHGRISVRSGTENLVRVQAVLRKPDKINYVIEQSEDSITITAEANEEPFKLFNFGGSPGADIEITAPAATRIELQTSNGGVEVHGITGSGTVQTSHGAVSMNGVIGDFVVFTSHGAVKIADAKGTFEIETSYGRIEFDGELAAGGHNRMETSNGGVEVKLRGVPSVKIDASTRNGTVETGLPIVPTPAKHVGHLIGIVGPGDAELFVRTSHGSVTID